VRVLVVGATGVVGRQLVPRLADAGHEVVATSRSAPEELWPTAEHRRLDLLDAGAVRALVTAVRPDAIVHQATSLARLGNNIRRFDDAFATTNRLRTEGPPP
jgi:nucleoside-diphosphate-sugar epimerase